MKIKIFILLATCFLASSLVFPVELKLREEVVAGPELALRDLFVNAGIVQGKSFSAPLGLGAGYHYLSQKEIREILGESAPALLKSQGGLVVSGEGVRVFVRNPEVADPLKNTPQPFPANEGELAEDRGSTGAKYFLVFGREWEGLTRIPRGTPVILRRETDRLSLELRGILVRDWDQRGTVKIRLLHSDKVLEESPGKGNILFL
ncbi:MAG: hypothetical protein JNM63_12555 [Spirochaetia bacterium]|nr:hypothetical protein [Spirochaetia bacterium]